MKIAIITTMAGHPWGGSEELWVAMVNEAINENHKVVVSVYNWHKPLHPKIQIIKEKGAIVSKRSRVNYQDIKGKIKGKLIQVFLAEKQLNKFINKTNPDIVFISMGGVCDLEFKFIRSFLIELKIPFYIIFHANPDNYIIPYQTVESARTVLDKAKSLYFVSNRMRQIAERQLAYNFSGSEIVANPVNMKEIGILSMPNSPLIHMAIVGRLAVNIKGQSVLLQILSSKYWNNKNWHLNIYGKGPDENIVKDLIKFYKLENKVTLHGHVNDIRNDIWAKNHILLMPSYYEGMPIALIEAMLCGRTTVASDVGGNMEVITNNKNGFIAEAPTVYSFDKAMKLAWENKHKWIDMGKDAFESASNLYGKNPGKELLNKILK